VIARHPRSYEREDFVSTRCITALLDARSALSTSGTTGRVGPARGIRHTASLDRGAHGQTRQTRVRPGAAAAGGVPPEDVLAASERPSPVA